VDARLGRRHAHDAEERREIQLPVDCASDARCEVPGDRVVVPGEGDAPVVGSHLLDADGERLPLARSSHLDRPGQGVARIEVRIRRRNALVRLDLPRMVRDGDPDRVAGVDRQNRLEVAREVAVQGPRLARKLVEH